MSRDFENPRMRDVGLTVEFTVRFPGTVSVAQVKKYIEKRLKEMIGPPGPLIGKLMDYSDCDPFVFDTDADKAHEQAFRSWERRRMCFANHAQAEADHQAGVLTGSMWTAPRDQEASSEVYRKLMEEWYANNPPPVHPDDVKDGG